MDLPSFVTVLMEKVQRYEPALVSKIIGCILLKEFTDRQMIRIAYGPESNIVSLVNEAKHMIPMLMLWRGGGSANSNSQPNTFPSVPCLPTFPIKLNTFSSRPQPLECPNQAKTSYSALQSLEFHNQDSMSYSAPQSPEFRNQDNTSYPAPQSPKFHNQDNTSYSTPQPPEFHNQDNTSYSTAQAPTFLNQDSTSYSTPRSLEFHDQENTSYSALQLPLFSNKVGTSYFTSQLPMFPNQVNISYSAPQVPAFPNQASVSYSTPQSSMFPNQGSTSYSASQSSAFHNPVMPHSSPFACSMYDSSQSVDVVHHLPDCDNFHSNARSNRRVQSYSGKACYYYHRGYCRHGTNCRFSHGEVKQSSTSHNLYFLNNEDPMLSSDNDGSLDKLECEIVEVLRAKNKQPISISLLPTYYYDKYRKTLQVEEYLRESQMHDNSECNLTRLLAKLKNIRLVDRPHGQHHVILAESLRCADCGNEGSGHVRSNLSSDQQIYLTFPIECSFKDKDVVEYFSRFGTVLSVRFPAQDERMYGFVAFDSPKTVARVLAKRNPHFIRGARVLVKPYKEKTRNAERKHCERAEFPMDHFSPCVEMDSGIIIPGFNATKESLTPDDSQLLEKELKLLTEVQMTTFRSFEDPQAPSAKSELHSPHFQQKPPSPHLCRDEKKSKGVFYGSFF